MSLRVLPARCLRCSGTRVCGCIREPRCGWRCKSPRRSVSRSGGYGLQRGVQPGTLEVRGMRGRRPPCPNPSGCRCRAFWTRAPFCPLSIPPPSNVRTTLGHWVLFPSNFGNLGLSSPPGGGGGNQHHPRYANYWAPLTHKRHPPHPAQPQHTNHWAPRTRKRHQQEHRPQRPITRNDPTQHAKGRTGDCPGPRKEAAQRNVTQTGGGGNAKLYSDIFWGVFHNGRLGHVVQPVSECWFLFARIGGRGLQGAGTGLCLVGGGGSGRIPSEEPCGWRWVLLSCP